MMRTSPTHKKIQLYNLNEWLKLHVPDISIDVDSKQSQKENWFMDWFGS